MKDFRLKRLEQDSETARMIMEELKEKTTLIRGHTDLAQRFRSFNVMYYGELALIMYEQSCFSVVDTYIGKNGNPYPILEISYIPSVEKIKNFIKEAQQRARDKKENRIKINTTKIKKNKKKEIIARNISINNNEEFQKAVAQKNEYLKTKKYESVISKPIVLKTKVEKTHGLPPLSDYPIMELIYELRSRGIPVNI